MRLHLINRRLRVLIRDIRRDPDHRSRKPPARHFALSIDDHVASDGRPVFARAERAKVRRQFFGEHRHDEIGEVDAVPAFARFLVDLRSWADIEADVGNRDNRIKAAVVARVRPDRVVKVARVNRINRDDGKVAQVLAVAKGLLCHRGRFLQRLFRKDMRNTKLVDSDQAERLWRERVSQDFRHPRCDARRSARLLREHQIARFRLAQIRDQRLLAVALVDGLEPETVALLFDDAQDQLFPARQLLHDMRDMTRTPFLGASQNTVANPKRTALALLNHAQPGRGLALGLPIFRHSDNSFAVNIRNPQHRDFRHSPQFVERTTRRRVDQPFIGHILQQRLKRDLVRAVEAKSARNLSLSSRRGGGGDEVEDRLPRGQAGNGAFGHEALIEG